MLPQTSGVLLANKKPTPQEFMCTANTSPSDMTLIYGNNVSITDNFPHPVIKVGDQTLLTIGKKGKGITVTGKLFSRDNRILAELKDNKFFINPNNYFRLERPDEHTLVVYDQQGDEALNVEFINPSVIKVFGRFYFPDRAPVIIDKDGTKAGELRISGNCVRHAGDADIVLE